MRTFFQLIAELPEERAVDVVVALALRFRALGNEPAAKALAALARKEQLVSRKANYAHQKRASE